jgi:peptidoglycan/LPS O-acetylase OafA/YrhL
VYTAGIALFNHLHFAQNVAFEGAVAACLVVCLLTVIAGAEIFYRLVDQPSQKLAHASFDWICR